MKLVAITAIGAAFLPAASAWGSLGHITTAFIASRFVANTTEAYFKQLLRNDTSGYLAGVATWADTIRYTKWGHFTSTFHFIDAKDHPPDLCNVDMERDCKDTGCVVTAIANYTRRSLDPTLPEYERAIAAKFVIHFIGDLHQPLHTEDVARGGNGIHVLWGGSELNLHHVWDSSIAERWIGGLKGKPYVLAEHWADRVGAEIAGGKFAAEKVGWLKGLDFGDAAGTALLWARESNLLVCSTVLPEGAHAIEGQELGGPYYDRAGPVVERQVARGGIRLAAWLDLIANTRLAQRAELQSTFGEL